MSRSPSYLAKGPPRLSLRKKLLFSMATCLLLLAGMELAWRIANGWNRHWLDCHRWHPVLGWCLREGWAGRFNWTGGYSRINDQGIRDDRPVGPKKPGEKRLLILGDSLTFGAKVRTEDTYPCRLEQALHQAGLPWRVLNGGVSSYDAAQEADWLELFGWKLEPDALAIGFCRNDGEPSDRGKAIGTVAELPAGAFGRWLIEHSIVAYKLQRGLWYMEARLGLVSATLPATKAYSGTAVPAGGWPFVAHAYRRIAERARARQLPVILIIFPTLDLLEGRKRDDFSKRLQALGQELGWPVIDLAKAFEKDAAGLFLENDPIHPNATGYKRAATELAKQVIQRQLLP